MGNCVALMYFIVLFEVFREFELKRDHFFHLFVLEEDFLSFGFQTLLKSDLNTKVH
jgi:hypothetical protein